MFLNLAVLSPMLNNVYSQTVYKALKSSLMIFKF